MYTFLLIRNFLGTQLAILACAYRTRGKVFIFKKSLDFKNEYIFKTCKQLPYTSKNKKKFEEQNLIDINFYFPNMGKTVFDHYKVKFFLFFISLNF